MCESELSVNRKERLVGSPFSVILMKRGLRVPINIDININQARVSHSPVDVEFGQPAVSTRGQPSNLANYCSLLPLSFQVWLR